MIFRDRQEAANKLYQAIKKDSSLQKNNLVVVSLLRGGVILGAILSKKLDVPHLPLVVTKIPAPYNEELAIGAICFDIVYLEKRIVDFLSLKSSDIREQIKIAEHKFVQYCTTYDLSELLYGKVKGKTVILVDDGVATGASVKAGLAFLRSKKASKVALAVPVTAADIVLEGFDKMYVLERPKIFGAVSRFYKHFPQVEDEDVQKILGRL